MVKWKQANLHVVALNSLHAEILKLQCILSSRQTPKSKELPKKEQGLKI